MMESVRPARTLDIGLHRREQSWQPHLHAAIESACSLCEGCAFGSLTIIRQSRSRNAADLQSSDASLPWRPSTRLGAQLRVARRTVQDFYRLPAPAISGHYRRLFADHDACRRLSLHDAAELHRLSEIDD